MKLDRAEQTRMEQQAGRERLRIIAMIDRIDQGTEKLRKTFPSLKIECEIPKPYDMVQVMAWSTNFSERFSELTPVEGYPNDEIVAKLALIS